MNCHSSSQKSKGFTLLELLIVTPIRKNLRFFIRGRSASEKAKRGFTLLELLIVIGIIAVVSSVTILVVNPGEYFRRSRDIQRIADLNNLHLALTMYYTSGVSNFDLDGSYTDSCSDEGSKKVFISAPSGVAGPANLPSGWTYASTTSANLRKTDGTGWMPVNLDSIQAGSPLNALPVDPVNDINQAFYYSYVCQRTPGHYELNANLESRQFNKGGDDDKTSKDGGDDPNVYEVGSRLTVNPMAPVGYWAMDEGTGTIVGDSSANGYTGTAAASNWTAGKVGNAANFNGSSDYINMGAGGPPLSKISGNKLTLIAWARPANLTGTKYIFIKNGPYQLYLNGSNLVGSIYNGTSWVSRTSIKTLTTSWNNTAMVYNGSSINLYIDGQYDSAQSQTGNLAGDACHQIGRYNDGGCSSGVASYFSGAIDEPRIYNRALSAAEILHYYNISR